MDHQIENMERERIARLEEQLKGCQELCAAHRAERERTMETLGAEVKSLSKRIVWLIILVTVTLLVSGSDRIIPLLKSLL